jgi:hypothetical protein
MLSESRSGEELENQFDKGMCFSSLPSVLLLYYVRDSLRVDRVYKQQSELSSRMR